MRLACPSLRRRCRQLLPALAMLWATGAGAATPAQPPIDASADASLQRQQIAERRAAIEQRHHADELACQPRFRVTDCLNQARAVHRQALAQLQPYSPALDDAERQQKAAQRLQAQQWRQGSALDRQPIRPVRQSSVASNAPNPLPASAPAPAAAAELAVPAHQADSRPTAAAERSREQRRRAQYDKRQAAAQEYQRQLAARQARFDSKHKPAAGLPVPAAGAASR